MRKTKRRVLYVFAALLGVVFVLACLAGFAACGGNSEHVHTWDAGVVTKEADCVNAGETTYTCTECGETKTETIPATGNHNWGEGEVTKEATTEAEGEITYTCTVCGATKTEKIDKKESSGDDDEGNTPGTGDEGGETPGGDENPGEGGGATGGDDDNPGDTGDHVLTGTYDSSTQQWTYTCSVCNQPVTLTEDTSVASLTLTATDEDSFEAAGLWGEVSLEDVTPVIDVATTTENSGTVSISSSNNHVGGGDAPMDKDVELNANIEMKTGKVLIVRCACTLDLNGHSISLGTGCTSSYGVIQVGATNVYGDLTVKDSSSEGKGKITGENGVTVRGDVNSNGDISTFTLVSGTVEGSNIAVSTNGSSEWGCEVVNIQGGTISGTGNAGVGVYMPNGTLNVTGGEISGTTGIEIKSGTANISGAAVSTTVTENPSINTNGQGTDSYGYAIAIISTNTSYHNLVSVTIGSGCTISGTIYSDVTSSEGTIVTVDGSLNLVKVAYDASGVVIADETAEGVEVDHYIYRDQIECDTVGHVLVGTYADGSWTYTCSVCGDAIELGESTLVASLTLEVADYASLSAAGTWNEITDMALTIHVVTTDENNGAISVTGNFGLRYGEKTIVLDADINMGSSYTIIVLTTVVLDLNGHTISRTGDTSVTTGVVQVGQYHGGNYIYEYGDLTVKDSSTNQSGKIYGSYGVTVFGGSVDNTDGSVSKFTLVSGTIEGSVLAISTNGSTEWGAEEITIQGGTVSGGAAGIYLPSGSLTVTDGSISGKTGIEIKASSASITGGKISTTETGQPSVDKEAGTTDTSGFSIAVIAGSGEGAYKDMISVSISGCELTGPVYVDVITDSEGNEVVTVANELGLTKVEYTSTGEIVSAGDTVDHYVYTAADAGEET